MQCIQQGVALQICLLLFFFFFLPCPLLFTFPALHAGRFFSVRPVTWENVTSRAFWAFCLLTFLGWSISCRHSSEDDFNWGIKHSRKPDSLFSRPSVWRRAEGGSKLREMMLNRSSQGNGGNCKRSHTPWFIEYCNKCFESVNQRQKKGKNIASPNQRIKGLRRSRDRVIMCSWWVLGCLDRRWRNARWRDTLTVLRYCTTGWPTSYSPDKINNFPDETCGRQAVELTDSFFGCEPIYLFCPEKQILMKQQLGERKCFGCFFLNKILTKLKAGLEM